MRSRACFASAFVSTWRPHEGRKLTISGEERDRSAVSSCPTGSANAMNVVLGVVGIVIVQHMANVAYILNERLATLPDGSYGVGDHMWSCDSRCINSLIPGAWLEWFNPNVLGWHASTVLGRNSWICSFGPVDGNSSSCSRARTIDGSQY